MASFTSGENIDWLWGSLKPWQILHSTLAERERCGSVLDVWELVNETLNASTTRGQEGGGGRSHGMHFLGDIIDGDFWRHGGVMETRVKEYLTARRDDDDERPHHFIYKCNTELAAIASSTQLSCAPSSNIAWKSAAVANVDHPHYCKLEEESQDVDHQEEMLHAAHAEEEEEGIRGYTEDELEDEEEEVEEEEEEEDEDSRGTPNTQITIRDSLISSNHQASPYYREIRRESASVLVLNPCCSAAAAVTGDDQAATVWGESGKLAEEMAVPPDLEENIEVCAVCLEKLTHFYEEGVQALACRHAFHTVCIAPWLQRQPHACCPCCRAPIFTDNLAPPLHLPAPLHLAADHHLHDRYACTGLHEEQLPANRASNDIMGLLADMEAALEHLGFRS